MPFLFTRWIVSPEFISSFCSYFDFKSSFSCTQTQRSSSLDKNANFFYFHTSWANIHISMMTDKSSFISNNHDQYVWQVQLARLHRLHCFGACVVYALLQRPSNWYQYIGVWCIARLQWGKPFNINGICLKSEFLRYWYWLIGIQLIW